MKFKPFEFIYRPESVYEHAHHQLDMNIQWETWFIFFVWFFPQREQRCCPSGWWCCCCCCCCVCCCYCCCSYVCCSTCWTVSIAAVIFYYRDLLNCFPKEGYGSFGREPKTMNLQTFLKFLEHCASEERSICRYILFSIQIFYFSLISIGLRSIPPAAPPPGRDARW